MLLILPAHSCDSSRRAGRLSFDCGCLTTVDFDCLARSVDPFLRTLDPAASENARLEHIRTWMEASDCVDRVVIEPATLTTEPPIRAFYLTTAGDGVFVIHILEQPGRWRLERFFKPNS